MQSIPYYFNRIMTHSIFRQLSWYTIGQVAVQIFAFLGVIITSRYLGPTNVGLYSFVQNYLGTFMTVAIGMDFYFTWKVAKSEDKQKDLAEYLGHKLNVTLLLTAVGVAIGWIILPSDVAVLTTVMFVPLIFTSCTAFFQYAVATNNARTIATFQILVALSLFIAKVVLVAVQAKLLAFVIVSALDVTLVATLLGVYYYRDKEIRTVIKESIFPSLVHTTHFMYSIRMSIIAIATWQLILRIDQLVLATFSNAYMLGIYSAAVKIAEVPNFLAGVLYTALVTHVALFAGKDDDFSKHRMQQILFLYVIAGLSIAVIVMLFATPAILFLYGEKFYASIPVLRAYALSIPGMFVTLYYFGVYGARDKHFSQAVIFGAGLALNVLLVYLLTPLYGLSGAAYATAITYTLVAVTFYFHVR
jgi:O-antigen/teichoic acid export membrane protein